MSTYKLTYKPFGESAVLIEWPAKIDEDIIDDIVGFEKAISKKVNLLDTVIAYNSLMLRYHEPIKGFDSVIDQLKELYAIEKTEKKTNKRVWRIPVCYDVKFGLDLEEIAVAKKLSVDEVIQLHSEPEYLIYFLGFQPGFLYLGGLSKQIQMARRPNPRLRVEKGSVGIGGEQTGVYPQDSSGGWNIIGKSPIDFFDVSKEQPCFAKAGDKIQFESIDLENYSQIEVAIKKGTYQIQSI
ncbi:MAG: 5-oxoprolinase subunit PxpB [Flavobacteriaceae bacterium]